jgi:hypothetical protein
VSVHPARDPRRLGLAAAAIIAGYTLVVAAISASAAATVELRPPELVPAPIRLALLFLLPAAVAAIGATRRSRPILLAAGVLCLAQSFIAFSGVTIPFVVPAVLLLALGARSDSTRSSRRARVGGVVVVMLGFAMWVAPFSMTETTCWVVETAADGTLNSRQVPVTETQTLGATEVGAGCDGGTVTTQGVALAAVFWIGAVTVATWASSLSPAPDEGTLRS